MTRKEKLEQRLYSKPKDFEWSELKTLLESKGYTEHPGSGSRVKFYHENCRRALISLHKRHPDSTLLEYQIKDVIKALEVLKK